MNDLEADKSTAETEIGLTAPPEWFLKRRARLEQLAQQESDAATIPLRSTQVGSPRVDRSVQTEQVPETIWSPVSVDVDQGPFDFELGIAATSRPVASSVIPISEPDPELANGVSTNQPPVPFPAIEGASNSDSLDWSLLEPAPVVKLKPKKKIVAPDELTPFQAFVDRWVSREALQSYAVSCGLHLLALLPLSLWVLHTRLQAPEFTTLISDREGSEEGFGNGGQLDDTILRLDPPGGQSGDHVTVDDLFSSKSVGEFSPTAIGALGGADTGPLSKGGGLGEGSGRGEGVGDGVDLSGFKMPEGGKAVRKGSFTVWTEPNDPAPGEAYQIVIQVKYKKPGQKLRLSDVTGMVRGTDGYECFISERTSRVIPEASQVVLRIPGADVRVQDTITVRSALLRESQRLQIVF